MHQRSYKQLFSLLKNSPDNNVVLSITVRDNDATFLLSMKAPTAVNAVINTVVPAVLTTIFCTSSLIALSHYSTWPVFIRDGRVAQFQFVPVSFFISN